MSGLEVIAAVAAVVSAFHGGSEILKQIKKKRRSRKARDQAQQEFEERQLQDSFVTGEQQIELRYAQDVRELGDFMRIGDAVARDRLFHIAFLFQGEIIKSLQMAVTHETAIYNIRLLHEASITKRNETFVTLDELKQRIIATRPIARQLQGAPPGMRSRHSSAVTLPSQSDSRDSRHGLTQWFRTNRSNSESPSTTTTGHSGTHAQAANVNLSVALEEFVRSRGSEDRAVIMKDIDEIISSYKGLQISNDSREPWGNNNFSGGHLERRVTLDRLNQGEPYKYGTMGQDRNGMPVYNSLPPSPEHYRTDSNPEYSAPKENIFDAQQEQYLYNQQPARNPYPHLQTQTSQPRWSNASASSSEAASLDRNSSSSSQGSNTQIPPISSERSPHLDQSRFSPVSGPPHADYQQHNEDDGVHSPSSAPYASPADDYTLSPAPLSPQRSGSQSNVPQYTSPRNDATQNPPSSPYAQNSSPIHKPWPGSQQHRESPQHTPPQQYPAPIEEEEPDEVRAIHPQYHLIPLVGRDTSSVHSSSGTTITPSVFAAAASAATTLGTAPATAGLRHLSLTPSIASTDSSGSGSFGILPRPRMRTSNIRPDAIKSGPVGQEKMMNGRPCKSNNYWGFCKGAWAVREDPKKGIAIRTQPLGLYNTKQIWECTTCIFKGDTFTATHPSKKNKTETVVDPRIHISMAGIRYRWLFLAKSHVKKKAGDSVSDECNYGCVLCSVEGNVTGVYGGVETLMNHIALTHIADMSEQTRKKVKCILGRVAGAGEDFDINVPIFAQVEELAG